MCEDSKKVVFDLEGVHFGDIGDGDVIEAVVLE